MKFLVYLSATFVLLLAACTEICFKEPQPRGVKHLTQIPARLHGYYLIQENDKPSDTLIILNTGYVINNDDVAYLSDSIVLKYYKGYFFLNTREDLTWHLRIIRQEKSGNLMFSAMDPVPETDDEKRIFLQALSEDVKVVESEVDGKTFYVIDPTPKELMALLKKGYFKPQTFTKVK
jgi:hypothetical protein